MIIFRSVLLRMRNASDASYREIKTQILYSIKLVPKIVKFTRKCDKTW
jgi:hypothetical protein